MAEKRIKCRSACRIAGRQMQSKCLHQTAKSGLTGPGIFVVSVFPFIHRRKRMLASMLLPKTLMNLPLKVWNPPPVTTVPRDSVQVVNTAL